MSYVFVPPDRFKVGDLITAYHKGYWRVIDVERRFYKESDAAHAQRMGKCVGDEYNPLLTYQLVLNGEFAAVKTTSKPKRNHCDASFCEKIDREWIINKIKEIDSDAEKYKANVAGLESLI
jgi:hypothetical protein